MTEGIELRIKDRDSDFSPQNQPAFGLGSLCSFGNSADQAIFLVVSLDRRSLMSRPHLNKAELIVVC